MQRINMKQSKNCLVLSFILMALFALAGMAQAATVELTIGDPSFEGLNFAGNANGTDPALWPVDGGLQWERNSGACKYQRNDAWSAAEGTTIFNLNSTGGSAFQYLGENFQGGQYTLTYYEYQDWSKNSCSAKFIWDNAGTLTILSTTNRVATGNTLANGASGYNEYSVTCAIPPGSPAIGQPVGIYFESTGGGFGKIDDIHAFFKGDDPITLAPKAIFPHDGGIGVSPELGSVHFQHDGVNVSSYRLFLKEGSAPTGTDMVREIADASVRSISLSALVSGDKTYYWYVEAMNSVSATQSVVRSFTTASASGGGGGPILPTTGLLLHLDASDINGDGSATPDGTAIAEWKDISGAGNHYPQAVVGNQPTKGTNAQGLPVLQMDGDDFFRREDTLGLTGNPAVTALFVVNKISSGGYQNVFYLGSVQGTGGTCRYFATDSSYRFNNGNRVFANDSLDGSSLILGEFSKGADLTYAGGEFYRNGIQSSQTAVGGATNVEDITGGITLVGTRRSGGAYSGYLTGNMAEVLIYDRLLTDQERSEVVEHLSSKWTLGLAVPSVNITNPGNNALRLEGTTVTLTADASDSMGGTIKQVEFFVDGVSIGVVTELDANNRYSLDWVATPGALSISVIATDNDTPVELTAGDSILLNIASPLYVTTAGGGDGTSFASALTIDAAITAANASEGTGSYIFMKGGVYDISSELFPTGNLLIYGGFVGTTETLPSDRPELPDTVNVTTLDGLNGNRIMTLDSTIVLNRLGFVNGKAESGGALYVTPGKNVRIIDCAFQNNTATGALDDAVGGGAIYVSTNANLPFLIDSCRFLNNTSASNGGAIFFFQANPSQNLVDCYFEGNTALNGVGGAIGQHNRGGLRTRFSTFQANSANIGGALGSTDSEVLRIHVDGCAFLKNVATTEGGAIFGGTISNQTRVSNSTFHGNSTTGGTTDGVWLNVKDNSTGLYNLPVVMNNLFSGHQKLALRYRHLDNVDPGTDEINTNIFVGGVADGVNGTSYTQGATNTNPPVNMMYLAGTAADYYVSADPQVAADLALVSGSPAIDAGLAESTKATYIVNQDFMYRDIEEKARFDGKPDIGAYELAEGGISLSSLELNFGFGLPVGVGTTQTLTITSVGNIDIEIQSATITGNPSSAAVFETVGDTDPFSPVQTLASGETLDVVVQMTPAKEGENYTGQIHIQTVGGASALSADLLGGTNAPPAAIRNSWLLYEM